MNMKYDVFISYSRKDLDLVKKIKTEIERLVDINCWMDLEDIESGEQFGDVIINAICKCNTILFMMSVNSMQSEWALDELNFAKHEKKRIVLVSIDNAEMTGKFYFHYHKYDTITWHNQPQREKLIRNLKAWIGIEQGNEDVKRKQQKIKNNCHENIYFDIILSNPGPSNLMVIKTLKDCLNLDLSASMAIVDNTPSIVKEGLPQTKAFEIKRTLEGVGAIVEMRKNMSPILTLEPVMDENNGLYGYAFQNGELVIPYKWSMANKFSEGVAAVKDANGKWGFIDEVGNLAIPCQFVEVASFSEGLAIILDEDRKYGFVDNSGKIVIPCKWDFASSFSDGLSAVRSVLGAYGYIDRSGSIVIPCRWHNAWNFSEGIAEVEDEHFKRWKIDKKGNVIGKG